MKLKVAVVVVAYLVLGFLAERVKVSLNFYLEQGSRIEGFFQLPPDRRDAILASAVDQVPYDYYYNHGRLKVYHRMTKRQLTIAKWGFAALLVLVYAGMAWGVVRWLDLTTHLTYIYVVTGVALLLALVFFMAMKVLPDPTAPYAVARKLLGFVQSPLPLIIVLFGERMHTAFR